MRRSIYMDDAILWTGIIFSVCGLIIIVVGLVAIFNAATESQSERIAKKAIAIVNAQEEEELLQAAIEEVQKRRDKVTK